MTTDTTTNTVHSALLVGSMNLDSADEVFETVGEKLGSRAIAFPDGETGDRLGWVMWQCARLRGIDELEVLDEMTFTNPGTEKEESTTFLAPREGVSLDDVELGPLGYADEAIESFKTFSAAKDAGKLPEGARFQVSIPTAMMFAMLFPKDRQKAVRIFETEIERELAKIFEAIPAAELAVQWDVAGEVQQEAMMRGPEGSFSGERWSFEETTESIARMSKAIPETVLLGVHLCYGDPGGEHLLEPIDTSVMTDIANSVVELTERRIDWIHMPVPIDRDDDAYFESLADLELPADTRLYLGLLHKEDGIEGAERRAAAAAKYVDAFGVATECGMGREASADVRTLLDIHAEAVDQL